MLQALSVDTTLGGPVRQKMERRLREVIRQSKELKKRPPGDFVKLLITHRGWNAAEVRKVIREPDVCRAHPDPTSAERIWVCERNVPPIGSWLLNYVAVEDEDLQELQRAALEHWEQRNAEVNPESQEFDTTCNCYTTVVAYSRKDVWRGYICTADIRKFKSPLVRALLLKGHAFKLEQSAESLLQELVVGLDGYIRYKTKRDGDPDDYKRWKELIVLRVKEKLVQRDDMALYPTGGMGHKEIKQLQLHLVFLKEDRAPHVVVGICKYRYMFERDRYLYTGDTFAKDMEGEEAIMKRHWDFHESRGLLPNHHIPYIYGIWKSAKRNLRWISGVRKKPEEKGNEEKPEGSIAGAGKELVGVLTHIMHALRAKDSHNRRLGKAKACWFIESVEEVAQPLRFDATEVAKQGGTATAVDFVTMYPSFDQSLLKERLADAIKEAWEWEEAKAQAGEVVRIGKDGWLRLSASEAREPAIGAWTREEVLELVYFVVDNGYIKRRDTVLKQVKGFGMGLACAPRLPTLVVTLWKGTLPGE